MPNTLKTCCFTGHRTAALPWGDNENHPACLLLKERLEVNIKTAILCGYRHFIFGAALGVDTYVGEILLALKKLYPYITIEAAIPCASQSNLWRPADKLRYKKIIESCDKRTLVSVAYTHFCMHLRNRYMVNNSSLLIAAVSRGSRGGTQSTIDYARKKGVRTLILPIDPVYVQNLG